LRIITLGFVLFGSLVSANTVWNLADMSMALMTITNVLVLFIVSPIALRLIKHYKQQVKQNKDPVFYIEDMPELDNGNITAWSKKVVQEKNLKQKAG